MGWGMGCAAGDDGSVNGIEVSPRDGGDVSSGALAREARLRSTMGKKMW